MSNIDKGGTPDIAKMSPRDRAMMGHPHELEDVNLVPSLKKGKFDKAMRDNKMEPLAGTDLNDLKKEVKDRSAGHPHDLESADSNK